VEVCRCVRGRTSRAPLFFCPENRETSSGKTFEAAASSFEALSNSFEDTSTQVEATSSSFEVPRI